MFSKRRRLAGLSLWQTGLVWACLQMDGLGLGCRFGRQLLPEWTSGGISLSLGVVLEDRFCGSISAEGQLCFRVSS
jgi:hypothetical protein